jgi:hypothetical protein
MHRVIDTLSRLNQNVSNRIYVTSHETAISKDGINTEAPPEA